MKASYSIGEVAKLCQVPPSTLRYYDEVGLVRPSVNEDNQYRCYTAEDIVRIRMVQSFRDLQFSVKEIMALFKTKDAVSQLSALEAQRTKLEQERAALDRRMAILDEKIIRYRETTDAQNLIDQRVAIRVKTFPDRRLVSIEKTGHQFSLDAYVLHFNELLQQFQQHTDVTFTNLLLIHHHLDMNQPFDEQAMRRLEFGTFGGASHQTNRILPGGEYVTWLQQGMAGRDKFLSLYASLQSWLKEHGYRANGPMIDVLITDPASLSFDRVFTDVFSEIQIRIEKVQQ